MDKATKEATVAELKEKLSRVASLVVADYKGLDVPTVTSLRDQFRKAQCEYKVYKNTLVKLAIAGTRMEPLSKLFEGTTAIMFSYESPSSAAKVATKFAKENNKFKVKGAYFEGSVMEGEAVESLASMPGKDELRATLLATLIAPAQRFVMLMNAPAREMVGVLAAKERKEKGG